MSYDKKFREKAIKYYEKGHTFKETANIFKISTNTLNNWLKQKIVYVDETGIDTCLYRQYCYAKRGEKVIGYIYGRKYSRVGIVAAQIGKKIISPLQYKGAMNSQLFEQWFENCLLSELS